MENVQESESNGAKSNLGFRSRPLALIVHGESPTREQLIRIAQAENFEVLVTETLEGARKQIPEANPDLILSDYALPDGVALELGDLINGTTGVVLVTNHVTVETVIHALRAGASDCLTQPLDVERLRTLLREKKLSRDQDRMRKASLRDARTTGVFGRLVGRSPVMLNLYHQIQRVAPTRSSVLLQGETGTGKEVAAQTIHDLSQRAGEPFIPMNCGAFSQTLIESELFGHERGSFTGANRRHIGMFERAHQGTLFLDEITEMPAELQVKLLRVLETREFQRVGGEKVIRSEARLIAATNRAPEEAIRVGKLREDLFYRLRVFPIILPPLHAREEDALLLAEWFLTQQNAQSGTAKRFTDEALECLREQEGPGNVRELMNLIERAFILADLEIRPEHLQLDSLDPLDPEETSAVSHSSGSRASADISIPFGTSIAEAEKRLILMTLERMDGNKRKAARILGISVKTLYTRLAVYNAR